QRLRREFVLDAQDARAGGQGEVVRGGGDGVADRTHHGDVGRRGADHARGRRAGALGPGRVVVAVVLPGTRLRQDAGLAGGAHRAGQRRPGGGDEIGDVVGQLEQVALAV